MPVAILCAAGIQRSGETGHFIKMHTKRILAAGVEIDNHCENNLYF